MKWRTWKQAYIETAICSALEYEHCRAHLCISVAI